MAAPPSAWGQDPREDCSQCAVAAILLYSDTMCPALHSSVHVHMTGGPAAMQLAAPRTFHVHRFTFMLLGDTSNPLSLPPGDLQSQHQSQNRRAGTASTGIASGASGAAGGAGGASIYGLSVRLFTFECESLDLLEGHVAQLRQRIESGNSTWALRSRFLHPLAAHCPAFGAVHNHLPVLPQDLPLEALAAMPLVHQDFLQATAYVEMGGRTPPPSLPAPAAWGPDPCTFLGEEQGGALFAGASDAWEVLDSLAGDGSSGEEEGAPQGASGKSPSPQVWPLHVWEEAVRRESQSLYALLCAGDTSCAQAFPALAGPSTPEKQAPCPIPEARHKQESLPMPGQQAGSPSLSPLPACLTAPLSGVVDLPRVGDLPLSRLFLPLFPPPILPIPTHANTPTPPPACNSAHGCCAPPAQLNTWQPDPPTAGRTELFSTDDVFPRHLAVLTVSDGPLDLEVVTHTGALHTAMGEAAGSRPAAAWNFTTDVSAEPLRQTPLVRLPGPSSSERGAVRSLFAPSPVQPNALVPSPSLPCMLGPLREGRSEAPPPALPLATSPGPARSAPLVRRGSLASLNTAGASSGGGTATLAQGREERSPVGAKGSRKRPQREAAPLPVVPRAASAGCLGVGVPSGTEWDEAEEEESCEDEWKLCVRSPGQQAGDGVVLVADRLEGVDVEQLREMFDRSITDAAEALGVGLTVLKKHCRALGISRWPHRKIDSINKLILVFEDMAESEEKLEILQRLVQERTRISVDPTAPLSAHIKMLRQAYFKASYKRRKACQSP